MKMENSTQIDAKGLEECCTCHYFPWTESIKQSLLFSYLGFILFSQMIHFLVFIWNMLENESVGSIECTQHMTVADLVF